MRDFELLSLMIRMLALIVAVLKDTKKQPPQVRLRLLFHKVSKLGQPSIGRLFFLLLYIPRIPAVVNHLKGKQAAHWEPPAVFSIGIFPYRARVTLPERKQRVQA